MELIDTLLQGDRLSNLVLLLSFLVTALALGNIVGKVLGRGLKFSLRVAVIGMPRSGKTTLITIIFDRIASGKIARYLSVTGQDTVARISEHMTMLIHGTNIHPTKDEDVFAYRYQINRSFGVVKAKYDVEIADFPGEYSNDLADNLVDRELPIGLYKKEFFSWVIRADRYVMVIDVEEDLRTYWETGSSSSYVQKAEVLFKNAVLQLKQELLDENIFSRHVIVVFTKSDLLFMDSESEFAEYQAVYRDPMIEERAVIAEYIDTFRLRKIEIEKQFSDLFEFLNNNFSKVESVFHSSYCRAPVFRNSNEALISFTSP